MTPYEVFDGAAEILRTHGWCQGEETSITGAKCLIGAIVAAGGLSSEPVWRYIRKIAAPGLMEWNDSPKRTLRQVLGILVRARALYHAAEYQ